MDNEEKPIGLLEATDLAKKLVAEYVTMNRCALIHTYMVDYINSLADDQVLTVKDIKVKLDEFEAAASQRVSFRLGGEKNVQASD